ncbi:MULTISPECIES: SpoIIE family protein phosphatase [unclassified Streptomyces]|uniref:SpoIIE family protein phosphatase n=1 Tax=unclassified Streptomyces TaxID=2593676 RepID=UPI0033ABCA97
MPWVTTSQQRLATLVVGALAGRGGRAPGLGEQGRQAGQVLREHGHGGYVTGQLLRISLLDGEVHFINAGHPWPLRMRDGKVQQIASTPSGEGRGGDRLSVRPGLRGRWPSGWRAAARPRG